jgi:hypothetical protein
VVCVGTLNTAPALSAFFGNLFEERRWRKLETVVRKSQVTGELLMCVALPACLLACLPACGIGPTSARARVCVCVCRVSSEGFVELALKRYRGDEHGLRLARRVLHVRRDKDHQALEAELLGGTSGAPPADDDGRRLSTVGGIRAWINTE